ncbi:LAETG motif-containing sortase-dependent surface protein [Actinacidiphila paucisporea]|uniref:LPXTG-motif cell wall anchor domain-containing protein n=1 Tax=Actinacidiphila paucisporea TaxID=310782 RepID=A0A1M7A792_9ACTN|nr:LAETG motif-containing sortase-dependent surface protein [Actinacidiphila paucisporea]SHL38533.1 LPXTG-motif cell wall anchor domain-containing protein [Actinacidiphila paucisporea]
MRLTVQGRRRYAAIAATGMAAMIGSAVMAGPASAHTPVWSVTCDSVTVDLTAYNTHATNSVTLTIVGGEGALADNPNFGGAFHYQDALPPHDAPISLHLVVKAGDDAKYDVDQTKVSPVCDKPTTTPPTKPATTPPTTAPQTTTPAPTHTTNAPVVADTTAATGSGDLAETGSSNATPMIAGIAAAVVVVGGGLVFWTRKRGTSAHR